MPAERKESPKRTLLAILVTAAVMSIAVLVIIYQEYYKEKFDSGFSTN